MPRKTNSKKLDDQLATVVEQEGVTLNTPQGLRVRKRVRDETFSLKANKTTKRIRQIDVTDPVEALDRATVARINKFTVNASGQIELLIQRRAHQRSAYVVSLQKILIKTSLRHPLKTATPISYLPPPLETYVTLSQDLTCEIDPRFVAQQFTPPTFEAAYLRVYGRTSNLVRAKLSSYLASFGRLFRRAERIEETTRHEVEVAIEHAVADTVKSLEISPLAFARAVAGFVALAFIVTLPANAVALYQNAVEQKSALTAAGRLALAEMASVQRAGSIPDSAEALKRASSRFRAVDKILGETNVLALGLASLMPQRLRSARALIEVGDKSSAAGRLLALGLDKLFSDHDRRLDERLDSLNTYVRAALSLLSEASNASATLDPASLPEEVRDKIPHLITQLTQAQTGLREFSHLSQLLSTVVGKESLRNYLLVFQNQTELRPTGGFMGSVAEITFDRGVIKKLSVPPGGTYDFKGQLLARVAAPEPLRLISARWYLHDANWSPDFPTSAQTIRWFWSQSGQPTLDGIIAINAAWIERLLDITGPIELPAYGKTIEASNFLLETQKAVELEYDKVANTPKKIIGALAEQFIARSKTFTREDWLKVVGLVSEGLETKDIQLALTKPEEEETVERYNWNGRLKDTPGDSLALIEANIAGQKTDGVISETVMHEARIERDGTIQDSVTLHRTHGGKKGELFRGVRNVSYLRAYIPKGSIVTQATGFQTPDRKLFKSLDEADLSDQNVPATPAPRHTLDTPGVVITDEGQRTVIGGWMQLDPGASQTITLTYRLPFRVTDTLPALDQARGESIASHPQGAYLLLLTSQSGKTTQRQVTSRVMFPTNWQTPWTRLTQATHDGQLEYHGIWDRDHVIAALLSTP